MSTAGYRIDFEEVKRAVSMEAVVAFLRLSGLKRKGPAQWKGNCPFCQGVDCFVVSNEGGREKTGAFNCFKCPAGGDQIELVSLMRGFPRKDGKGAFTAAKELHERFLAKAEAGGGDAANRSDPSPQPRKERRQGFDPVAYVKTLDPEHEALTPLGVAPETYRAWQAGFAASGVNRGRLALPVTGKDGGIIGFVGRSVADESPRLAFPNGLDPEKHIFGADRVTVGQLYLVRDPLDVLKAFESGCGNVVAFLTDDITGLQLECLAALMDERGCDSLSFF